MSHNHHPSSWCNNLLIQFQVKEQLLLTLILLFILSCTITDVSNHSLTPTTSGSSSCGDVFCLHGRCVDGSCVCDQGWQGSACHRCGGRIKLDSPSGFLTDGMTNYSIDLQCTWLIDSGRKGSTIRMQFMEFETECGWDHLYIFDGDSVFAPLIAAYSGLLVNDARSVTDFPEIVASSGQVYLYFYSDAAYNMSGFNVSYSIDGCRKNCSKHGTCDQSFMTCQCDGGWDGPACDVQVCPNKCSGNGDCDPSGRKCICNQGFTGPDCGQLESQGFWTMVEFNPGGGSAAHDGGKRGRALHAAAVIGNDMYITGGEYFSRTAPPDFMVRYNFKSDTWTSIKVAGGEPESRFAHTMISFSDKLFLYGGMYQNHSVTSELWIFDTMTTSWDLQVYNYKSYNHHNKPCKSSDYCPPIAVMGHTATLVDNKMIVIFGHNPNYGYVNTVQELNLGNGRWSIVEPKGALVKGGFGHTSTYDPNGREIFVFGGYHSYGSDSVLVDLLYSYNPHSRSWRLLNPSHSPRYLHGAVIINNALLVYGGNGHNASHEYPGDKCFSAHFMMYDIECDSWKQLKDVSMSLKSTRAAETGRFGHATVLYQESMVIHGGFNGLLLNSILKYTPGNCSAIGSRANCIKSKPGTSCSWNEERAACTTGNTRPHSFNGNNPSPSLFNTFSSNNGYGTSGTEVAAAHSLSLNEKCPSRSESSNFTDLCHRQTTCPSCLENSYDCVWCSDTCSHEKCKKSGAKAISDLVRCDDDILSELVTSNCDKLHNCHSCHTEPSCGWQIRDHKCYTYIRDNGNRTHKVSSTEMEMNQLRPSCDIPCHLRSNCANCSTGPSCMWCTSTQSCIESNAYAAVFPIGQCMEWTIHPYKCTNCSEIQTCDKCQLNPRCGWCDDGTGTGVGTCMEGSAGGPMTWSLNSTDRGPVLNADICPSSDWHFTNCPTCQCNGHSTCLPGTNECLKPCNHLTEGSNCGECRKGYFGDPVNGGKCKLCECNNHSTECNKSTGKCFCTTKGIIGDTCSRCDEQNHYFGDPTADGGSCYYNLTIDFQYTFNMSKYDDKYLTSINFMNVPMKPDIDVDFTIACSANSLVNISIGSGSFPIRVLHERIDCGSFKFRFSHDEHLFGIENTTFYVHVFDFKHPFVLQISFSQHRTLDLLQFFVTFSSCFLTLLIIAAILWKIKQKYDLYRRRQQLFLELEHMASRPFAGITLELDQERPLDASEPFALWKMNSPTPVALEPCSTGKAAVLTIVIKLPTGGSGTIPPGQTGLAMGSALVSLGTLDQKCIKEPDSSNYYKVKNSMIVATGTGSAANASGVTGL